MDEQTKTRFNAIWAIAQIDQAYGEMSRKNAVLEKRYFDVLESLPTEQQDVIQDFLMSCEDMSWRMLELACEVMRFP